MTDNKSENPGQDYTVGYRKPPRETRFKRGQSGNLKGRPRGSLNAATLVAKALREKIVIVENGQRKTVSKFEAALKQLVSKAVSGEPRALRQLLDLAREAEAKEHSTTASETVSFDELDQEVIRGILERFAEAGEDNPKVEEANNSDAQSR